MRPGHRRPDSAPPVSEPSGPGTGGTAPTPPCANDICSCDVQGSPSSCRQPEPASCSHRTGRIVKKECTLKRPGGPLDPFNPNLAGVTCASETVTYPAITGACAVNSDSTGCDYTPSFGRLMESECGLCWGWDRSVRNGRYVSCAAGKTEPLDHRNYHPANPPCTFYPATPGRNGAKLVKQCEISNRHCSGPCSLEETFPQGGTCYGNGNIIESGHCVDTP